MLNVRFRSIYREARILDPSTPCAELCQTPVSLYLHAAESVWFSGMIFFHLYREVCVKGLLQQIIPLKGVHAITDVLVTSVFVRKCVVLQM